MNAVIITGASGFVGQNLIQYFNENGRYQVISLSLREELLPAQLPLADAVIHLAGKAHDVENTCDAQEYFDVNYGKTKALFDLFLASEINDFVYFSSVKAVADTVGGVLTENSIPNPKTPYGQSKLQAEEYLLSKDLPAGKRLIILRPCMIHGPGNKGNLNLLYRVVKKGIPYPLGAFDNQRSFLSIDNLNTIIGLILDRPKFPSGIYHIADDGVLSTNELIEIIAEATDTEGRIWKISKSLLSTLAKIGDRMHLPLNTERLKKLTESYVVSNEKIKRELNIPSLPVLTRDGLLKTIRSFK